MESYFTPSLEQLYVECQYLYEQCEHPLTPPDVLQQRQDKLGQKAAVFEKLFESKYNLFNITTATFSDCETQRYNPSGLIDFNINTIVLRTPFYVLHHEGTNAVQHTHMDDLHIHYVGVRRLTVNVGLLPSHLQARGNYAGLAAYGYAEYEDSSRQTQPILMTVPLGISQVLDHPQINN